MDKVEDALSDAEKAEREPKRKAQEAKAAFSALVCREFGRRQEIAEERAKAAAELAAKAGTEAGQLGVLAGELSVGRNSPSRPAEWLFNLWQRSAHLADHDA